MNNRKETHKLNGSDSVEVTYLNGAVFCSLVSDKDIGKASKGSTEEPALGLIKMTYKALRQEVVKGNKVYNKAGQSIPCTQRAEKTPDKQVQVTTSKEGKIIKYQIV